MTSSPTIITKPGFFDTSSGGLISAYLGTPNPLPFPPTPTILEDHEHLPTLPAPKDILPKTTQSEEAKSLNEKSISDDMNNSTSLQKFSANIDIPISNTISTSLPELKHEEDLSKLSLPLITGHVGIDGRYLPGPISVNKKTRKSSIHESNTNSPPTRWTCKECGM